MSNMIFNLKRPINEKVYDYRPGSKERVDLKNKIDELKQRVEEIPLIIGGKEIKTGNLGEVYIPHNNQQLLARYHKAGEKEVKLAIETALKARAEWEKTPWEKRAAVFEKAACLLSGPYRQLLNASTMLGQSKNAYQAEIDSACELIDFLRFNNYFMTQIYSDQPESTPIEINKIDYRPLEGFVLAIPPFNFTSIGGNLATAPALMGNVVLWKPASTAIYSNYYFMKLLMEAGLPDGVINFIPGPGSVVGPLVMDSPWLAGIHFTGSVEVLNSMYKTLGKNIDKYRTYPRIVGETGGKDFIFAHQSADEEQLITSLIRGAFEYQGQKCSAVSRAYIPENLWKEIKEELINITEELKMGDIKDFSNFINAVIDEKAFNNITSYIEYARKSKQAVILAGGKYSKEKGYFIEPTIVLTEDPHFKLMEEEIFGPVLTIYVYPEKEFKTNLKLCNNTSPFALTGAIFAREEQAVKVAQDILKHAAGNFYINDKPTGAVVGRQPFGGSRASGTNDKAGSKWNLMRWVSPQSIKENLMPPTSYSYPFMLEQ